MKTSLFSFHLPESLIATAPASPRDSAKMLVVADYFANEIVSDFPKHLRPHDIVVFNNTRVIPARLIGFREAAKVEVLLHRETPRGVWACFAKPAKRLRAGDSITFSPDFSAQVVDKQEDGQVLLAFDVQGFQEKLHQYGQMPLPPYIEKKRAHTHNDTTNYQTIYAEHDGSVAAPTAGLHFTPALLATIDAAGATRAHVTLHVGGGTFLPVKTEDTSEHKMHSEWAEISAETAAAINAAKAHGGRVVAVGTTSLRTLESATDAEGIVQPFAGETAIFITPGYRFKCVDMLLTNFHLPRSTLFMLVSAFAGLDKMQAAYAHAISNDYRFYSYGDACLLNRNAQ